MRPGQAGRPYGAGGGVGEPFDGDFDAIIVYILDGLGSADWDLVETTWGMHRWHAMARHWREISPPMGRVLAAYAGWKPPIRAKPQELYGAEDLANFLQAFPGGEMVKPPAE